MSDVTYQIYQHYGTNAERIAFTPDPPAGYQPIYIWYETDTDDVYVYTTAWHLVVPGTGIGDVVGPGSSTDEALARFDGTTGKLLQDSAITLSNGGVLTFPDDVRQTFNPGTNNPGINVGSFAGDPATPSNGDVWYNSSANQLKARINGATVILSADTGITQLTGDVTAGPGSGSVAATIANSAVTYAKIQNVTDARLLGNFSGGAAAPSEYSLGVGLEHSGGAIRTKADIRTTTIGITVDGGGSVVTTGDKGFRSFPVAGTIIAWRLMADVSGDVDFDVTLDDFASFPPTTSVLTPSLSGTQSDEATGLSQAVVAGDVFGFEVTGTPATITRVTLELTIVVTG